MSASGSDIRLVPAAGAAWAGAFLGTTGAATVDTPAGAPVPFPLALVVVAAATLVAAISLGFASPGWGLRHVALASVIAMIVGTGALVAGLGRVAAQSSGPVVDAAAHRGLAEAELRVTSDPLPRSRPPGAPAWQRDGVRLSAVVVQLRRAYDARSPPSSVSTPVVVLAPLSWAEVRIGEVVVTSGRLSLPTRPGPAAAVLRTSDPPEVLARVMSPFVVGDAPRRALRDSVAGYDDASAGLLPSLVVGDESLLTPQVREELRVTGLAHLTAVSGANVAIILGAVLLAGRWVGVRGRGLTILGVVAIVGFVLLARPEPSVVRASVMGAVVVLGLASGRRRRGVAPLALAVTVLLMADPWLARSLGFALSAAATAAIVVLARPWARAAATWLPRPVAGALAVPLAAQLACTPLLVGMSGEVSLSAVPANVLAAPAVAPATVLGVVAAAVGLVSPWAAHVVAGAAMVPSTWIVVVAQRAAALPGTSVAWGWGVPAAVVASLALVLLAPSVLRSAVASAVVAACVLLVLVRPVAGWPPEGWVVAACDVGQGDALVLRTGPDEAVVVDAGPDPPVIDRCLRELGVRRVPMLVVTHLHADHVGGVDGVSQGRTVSAVLVTVLDEPAEQALMLADWSERVGVVLTRAAPGMTGRLGWVHWSVLWPQRVIRGQGSSPNQASVVLRVEVKGVSVLLTGDIETAAQRALLAGHGSHLDVDVLKVPHHGSADQYPEFLAATHPAVALVTVGAENDYGHPDPAVLDTLRSRGAVVARTDQDGDLALAPGDDGVRLYRRGGA
jgi:competence protein ComEC